MAKLNTNTQNVLVYGTDGETALGEGFGRPLPYAQHLLCGIHMKDNVTSKLNEFGIRAKACEIIPSNIFENILDLQGCQVLQTMTAQLTSIIIWIDYQTSGICYNC